MNKITPFLTFNHQAEAAMLYYTSVFKQSKVLGVNRYGKGAPAPEGSVMTASFELNGTVFTALNAGPEPMFEFTPAVSFVVECDTQAEVDHYWDKLGAGGKTMACGWLTDQFGVAWQIVPRRLIELMSDPDAAKAGRVMQAMMTMIKIDIAALEKAAASQ
jgi:predicted 3-demethylubiquinone-9 3-methyltransferase (glyoxalase superfamily)